MTICPKCGEFVATTTNTCPGCGTAVEQYDPSERAAARRRQKNRALKNILITTGCVLAACGGLFLFVFYPAIHSAREAGRRTHCLNRLRSIGTALMSYHSQYGSLPPAYIADAFGKPMHSWRVLILPYLDEQQLYDAYDFSEPWDGPNNSRLLSKMPSIYGCPSHAAESQGTYTAYAGVFGEHCMFRGADPVGFDDVPDGLGSTLLVGETAGTSIPWTKPVDIDIKVHPLLGDREGFSSEHDRGVNFVWCDVRVTALPKNLSREKLKAFFSRDGGERVAEN
jgi:hypothetical protein